ncbi:MAG: Fpg/Nei family DNA glycosylase [Oligoflexia bacterium]|nr:Fpg/Nei family DNA glycosylase [Oligoflexia bacterium]
MPELAEVETIRSQLQRFLPLEIVNISTSSFANNFIKKTKSNFPFPLPTIEGSSLIKINRHGKYLIFQFNNVSINVSSNVSNDQNQLYLLSHLGMSGYWQIRQKNNNSIKLKHVHLSLVGKDISFDYIDPRRFGMFALMDQKNLKLKLTTQGPDLTSKKLNTTHIKKALLRYPNRSLKKILLDQTLFAGMGNYLANEVCAHARILPCRLAKDILIQEVSTINKTIKKVVNIAIKSKGTTLSKGGYKNAEGEFGKGINNLVVFYQEICGMCGQEKVVKTYIDGRGTYYCPKCQH